MNRFAYLNMAMLASILFNISGSDIDSLELRTEVPDFQLARDALERVPFYLSVKSKGSAWYIEKEVYDSAEFEKNEFYSFFKAKDVHVVDKLSEDACKNVPKDGFDHRVTLKILKGNNKTGYSIDTILLMMLEPYIPDYATVYIGKCGYTHKELVVYQVTYNEKKL